MDPNVVVDQWMRCMPGVERQVPEPLLARKADIMALAERHRRLEADVRALIGEIGADSPEEAEVLQAGFDLLMNRV